MMAARAIIYFLVFLVGLLVGVFASGFGGITLKSEVTYAEIINVILVVVLAAFAPYFVEVFISNRRIEKNIIIDELNGLRNEIEFIDSKLFSCTKVDGEDLFQNIMIRLKKIRQTMEAIENISSKLSSLVRSDISRLDSLIVDYWEMITGVSGLTPNTNKVTSALYRKQSMKSNEISKVIRHAVIKVNRL
jgi:hypothetical protein